MLNFLKTENHKKIETFAEDISKLANGLRHDVQEEYDGAKANVSFELTEEWEPFDDRGVVVEGEAWHRISKWVNTIHADLQILEVKCKKGFKLKRHDHDDHIEICIVLKGSIAYPMQNKILISGNTIEIPMDTKHIFEAIEDSFCLMIYKPKF